MGGEGAMLDPKKAAGLGTKAGAPDQLPTGPSGGRTKYAGFCASVPLSQGSPHLVIRPLEGEKASNWGSRVEAA